MKALRLFVAALIFLALVGSLFTYSYQDAPAKLVKQVADAPLVEPAQLANFSNTNRLVKCRLFTGSEPAPDTQFYFERLCQEDLISNSESTLYWRNCGQEPETLALYSKNKDSQVTIAANLIDDNYLPVVYFDNNNDQLQAMIPNKWRGKIFDTPGRKIRVTSLPLDTEVLVAGWVVPSDHGLKITTFGAGGFAHKVIVTVDSLETLLARLRLPMLSTSSRN